MSISTNQKPTIYRNLYENTAPVKDRKSKQDKNLQNPLKTRVKNKRGARKYSLRENTLHHPITYINSLYLLQKKVVRTMSKVGRLDHTNALFVDLKLLKLFDLILSDLIDLKIAIIVFKVKQKVLQPNIMNYF